MSEKVETEITLEELQSLGGKSKRLCYKLVQYHARLDNRMPVLPPGWTSADYGGRP